MRKQRTCSIEVSQKIAGLGIKLDTYFYHQVNDKGEWGIGTGSEDSNFNHIDPLPAPQAGELGEMLSKAKIRAWDVGVIVKDTDEYDCTAFLYNEDPELTCADTLEDAMGLMVCWLVEHGDLNLVLIDECV